jgi:3-phosphoshikimate 1-carboxyvinyltransferase
MTSVVVRPGSLSGRVRAPGSKSYTHRALVAAHLSRRRMRIERPLDSDDTRTTADALRALGDEVRAEPSLWTVVPGGGDRSRRLASVNCHESGTTLRFAVTLAALRDVPTRFTGAARLADRPMAPLLLALRTLGADCGRRPAGFPLTIRGPIHAGTVKLDASMSSQFASSLLLSLPTLPDASEIGLRGTIVSEPYLDATVAFARSLGIRIGHRARWFSIPGGQRYPGGEFLVPGDASSAAYLWTAAALGAGDVTVDGIPAEWPQADRAILPLLSCAGASVRSRGNSVTVSAGPLRPFSVDLTACPDLYPLAGALAASIPGRSRLRGAAHVVHKESDRRRETARLVRALGATVQVGSSGMVVVGRRVPRPVRLDRMTDHRLVMSAAVASLAADGPSVIGDSRAVTKSYPAFWDALRDLGAEVVGP